MKQQSSIASNFSVRLYSITFALINDFLLSRGNALLLGFISPVYMAFVYVSW